MEILDVVNNLDEVIATAERSRVYEEKLPHRIVHVLLFNTAGKMALQLRSQNVSFMPNTWSTAVGGHVRTGETYEQAALRESREELGVELALDEIHKDFYKALGLQKFLRTFRASFEGPFEPDPQDVASVDFFSLEQIQKMLTSGEQFHPELTFLLAKHYGVIEPRS